MKELKGWTCLNMIACKGDQFNQQTVACCTQSRRKKCEKEGVCHIVMPQCLNDRLQILKKFGVKMSEHPYLPGYTSRAYNAYRKALTTHLKLSRKQDELVKKYGANCLRTCKAVIIKFGLLGEFLNGRCIKQYGREDDLSELIAQLSGWR